MRRRLKSWFQGVVERAILKLYKTGSIDVTVRHVVPNVKCGACKGTGRAEYRMTFTEVTGRGRMLEDFLLASQGVCLACRGRAVID